MTITKRCILDLADLKSLQITCPNKACGVSLTIPFSRERNQLPWTCPHCTALWYEKGGRDSDALHDLFHAVIAMQENSAKHDLFRIEISPPQPE